MLDQAKRRALTPAEAGRLLAPFPLCWWDHVLCLLGTGLRFGELARLRRRRIHLDRPQAVLQVVDTRYQAGRFGSGLKARPKSDAGIRELPLAPCMPLMLGWFTSQCTASPTHATEQVKGAAEGWVVGRRPS